MLSPPKASQSSQLVGQRLLKDTLPRRHKQIACHRSSCSRHGTVVCSEGACHGRSMFSLQSLALYYRRIYSTCCGFVGLFLQNIKRISYKNYFFPDLCLPVLNRLESLRMIHIHSQFENKRIIKKLIQNMRPVSNHLIASMGDSNPAEDQRDSRTLEYGLSRRKILV